MNDYSERIEQCLADIIQQNPDFTIEELREICDDFLNGLRKKTKETKKEQLLLKYLRKEFALVTLQPLYKYSFSSIPKTFFQSKGGGNNEPMITISKLDKRLGTTQLFDQASMQIKPGDKIALIGKNGAGKSTILSMIIGKEPLNAGSISIKKGMKIGFLSQDIFREYKDRTVREEMLTSLPLVTQSIHRVDEITKKIADADGESGLLLEEQSTLIERLVHNDAYKRYDLQTNILYYFGFTPEQLDFPLWKLSGGEQTKLQIAKFLLQEVDILILDEPTNHLDIEGIMFLEKFCLLRNKTMICISHDKTFLNTAFAKTIEISNQKLHIYQGNYDQYLAQKAKNYELQRKQYITQQKYIAQQERFIERFRYKDSKAAQVQSRIKMMDKLEKIAEPELLGSQKPFRIKSLGRLPNMMMKLENIAVGYAEVLIDLPPVIEITKEMKIGIIGKNGIGKTTLIKSILGDMPLLAGEVTLHPQMRIGSYAQIIQELAAESTVINGLMGGGVSYKEAMSILGTLGMKDDKMQQKIATLSGGERAKVALAKMLLSKPHIIIMDEPTNHLDIQSKETIKAMLQQFDGVTLIVSHDRDFLQSVSSLLWVIKNKSLTIFHSLERGFEEMIK